MRTDTINDVSVTRCGPLVLHYKSSINVKAALKAIVEEGQILKRSSKFETCRVGDWVVKRSRLEGGLGIVKRTLARGRYRQAWVAANYLQARGVNVPAPLAYAENIRLGVIFKNALVTEFLEGCINVEVYAAKLVASGAADNVVDAFFQHLARALDGLEKAGAYHADLSGKNIFTSDGEKFYFIDLDSVLIGMDCNHALRMKNHVQLYDSFCDFCDSETLARFHRRILPPGVDTENWICRIRQGQQLRRTRHRKQQNPN